MRAPFIALLERLVFGRRRLVLAFFAAATVFMAFEASKLRIDAGFEKMLPLRHPYIHTFLEFRDDFGGANRLLIALEASEGDIFTAEFFRRLKALTDEVFFLPGVNRPSVRSIVTPNVRFIEIVEGGFAGGNVVPAEFSATPEQLAAVRENVLKAGLVGRLVSKDFRAAMIAADLVELDPATGQRLDLIDVAHRLDERIRKPFSDARTTVHIIGFAPMIGDIADGAAGVIAFFAVAVIITAFLVWFFMRSVVLTVLPLFCSVVAVTWDVGLLNFFGFGLDPMTILVPFLVFAIGVSHGVQMASAFASEVATGTDPIEAAKEAFRDIVIPGGVAVVTSAFGFFTLLLIDIDMVQELALTAGMGVAVMLFTIIFLAPVLLSYLPPGGQLGERLATAARRREWLWRSLSHLIEPRMALVSLAVGGVLLVLGFQLARGMKVGDLQAGVPELRPDSRYNRDADFITKSFSVGVDVIAVVVRSIPDGCIEHDVMKAIDDFEWHMQNVPGVHSTASMPQLAKIINAGWNEGSLKWRVLPRNSQTLVQSVSWIDTSTGLLNRDCSAMPVVLFLGDHKAETIERVVEATKEYATLHDSPRHRFTLATGNVGVMAATNEVVEAAQLPMMFWVYAVVATLVLSSLRSVRGTLSVLLPLGLVSVLCNALMTLLGIGLKVSTLPICALGVGLGDDYGIYLFSRMREELDRGATLSQAWARALPVTGNAVLVTGLTLALGVSTWVFSALKFQADMGLLLSFMMFTNMLGALFLLPAITRVLFWTYRPRALPSVAEGRAAS